MLLLFTLALGSAGLAALGELESTRQRRDREAELRFRGQAIAEALARYAQITPTGRLPLPQRLDELLHDTRLPTPQRHLRQLYADPFTGAADWELIWGQALPLMPPDAPPAADVQPGRGIVGLRSRSTRSVLASPSGRPGAMARDWIFRADTQTAPESSGT